MTQMVSPKEARAQRNSGGEQSASRRASAPAPATSFAQQVELARQIDATRWRVPSASVPGLDRVVDISRPVCSCPGNTIAHKNGHSCRHESAVYTRIAQSILEIVGLPDGESISDAMKQIERGGGTLRERYYCDGHNAPRYGYAPNRVLAIRWSIGLKPEARSRMLPAVERRACLFVLGTMLSDANDLGAEAA
jgi:hypothetical protein